MYSDVFTGDIQDKRFFGIYRGIVVSNQDPSSLNRIKMQVPQVLGSAVTSWCHPVIGIPVHAKFPYGNFHASFDQTISSTTTNYIVGIDTIDDAYGVYLDSSDPSNSHIHVLHTGVYNIQFSAQIASSDTSVHNANIWLRINGVDLPASNGQVAVPSKHGSEDGQIVASWNYVNKLNAGDYIEFVWNSSSTSVFLENIVGGTSPMYPTSPSFAVTMTLSGGYVPEPGDNCWVMFEGGDPNFPLWVGAF